MSGTTQAGALWLLATCAACVLAVSQDATRKSVDVALVVFGAVLAVSCGYFLPWSPSAGEVATIIGCACGWHLLRPGPKRKPLLAAGVCAALAVAVQVQQGAPAAISLLLMVLLTGSAVWLASRGAFAPLRMREQALTGIILAAPVIGALPGVMSGWQSAVTINLAATARNVGNFPAWVWQFAVAMLALGVLRELWVRR